MPCIRITHNAIVLLLLCILSGCGTVPQHNNRTGVQIVSYARALIGNPYHYGGNTPAGFDCSGLVQYAYHQAGIAIPRTTRQQLKLSTAVSPSQRLPGDIIFFHLDGRKVSHVGLYVGGNSMIHAPSGGKHVSYARLDNGYWERHIIKTGRFY